MGTYATFSYNHTEYSITEIGACDMSIAAVHRYQILRQVENITQNTSIP